MLRKYSYFLVFCVVFLRDLHGQRDAHTFCKRSFWHMSTASSLFMCCGYDNLEPGFLFVDYWEECSKKSIFEEEDLHDSLWRVYSCMVSKATKSENQNFVGFAVMMSRNYPMFYKQRIINDIISYSEQKFNLIEILPKPYDELRNIRRFYYKTEMQVCRKKNETNSTKSVNYIGNVINSNEKGCDLHLEHFHTRGGCCNNKTIPISLDFFPKGSDVDIIAEWQNILNEIAPKTQSLTAQRYCFTTSAMLQRGYIRKSELMYYPHLETLIPRLLPQYLSTPLATSIKQNILSLIHSDPKDKKYPEGTKEMYRLENIYNDKLRPELKGVANEEKAKTLFLNCGIHVLIRNHILDELYKICDE